MSDTPHLDGLPSLSQRRRLALSQPKPIRRLDDRIASTRADDKAWSEAKRLVDLRDENKCRVCGCRVIKTVTLDPKRAEHHHIIGRAFRPLRYDVRNLLLVCKDHHDQLGRHQIHLVGAPDQYFEFEGKLYLNADCQLSFV